MDPLLDSEGPPKSAKHYHANAKVAADRPTDEARL